MFVRVCVWKCLCICGSLCMPASFYAPFRHYHLLALGIIIFRISLSLSLTHISYFSLSLSFSFSWLLPLFPLSADYSSCFEVTVLSFHFSVSVWLWCTNTLLLVTVTPGSLGLNSPLSVQEWWVSFLWKKKKKPTKNTKNKKKPIIYNLSSVIFLVYSPFLWLLLPVFLCWVSHLITPIILLVLTSSAHVAGCH